MNMIIISVLDRGLHFKSTPKSSSRHSNGRELIVIDVIIARFY